jgi:hypothetical protein
VRALFSREQSFDSEVLQPANDAGELVENGVVRTAPAIKMFLITNHVGAGVVLDVGLVDERGELEDVILSRCRGPGVVLPAVALGLALEVGDIDVRSSAPWTSIRYNRLFRYDEALALGLELPL